MGFGVCRKLSGPFWRLLLLSDGIVSEVELGKVIGRVVVVTFSLSFGLLLLPRRSTLCVACFWDSSFPFSPRRKQRHVFRWWFVPLQDSWSGRSGNNGSIGMCMKRKGE